MEKGTLYLVPNTLGSDKIEQTIPSGVSTVVNTVRHFIVESEKSAKSLLRKFSYPHRFEEINFYLLNEHTTASDYASFIKPLKEGHDVGIISDAGCPGIADPGAEVVRLAQQGGYTVKPLTGPSSILLALIGSGMNGQSFTFHGYLPYEKQQRQRKIQEMEKHARSQNATQLFIEAPYRNRALLNELLEILKEDTLLGIACDLTLETEIMQTKTTKAWKSALPEINKRPCIFLIGS